MITDTRLDPATTEYRCGYKCISWSAIIIGALVGLGLSFLFHLFSMATGLAVFNVASGNTLAIGGFIGMLISVLISTFAGGWVSGFLAKPTCYNEYMGVLYGFTTWCLALLLTAWMSFHVSHMLSASYQHLAHPEVINITENMVNSATDNRDTSSQPSGTDNQQRNATSQDNQHRDSATATTANAAPALGIALFVVFVMFFLGAISSCFGGYFGLKSRCGEGRDRPTV